MAFFIKESLKSEDRSQKKTEKRQNKKNKNKMEELMNNRKTILEEFPTIFGLPSSVFRHSEIINHQ